ncbi:hypothetical protein BDA99DRAFT_334665 [Phascolomyces articulosus]|uniref:F-box domain-containing protein n=1 Tax=Phascolomyces articulosus TaxID=60185 RepID=A0AAD5JL91_9FUNG|nr:hypothetical protein BDA99DRAFT_334665 [Phascolomyces articulosus]
MISQDSFDLIQNVYRNHNLDQIIDFATDAVNHVQQWELILVLDRRAHVFGIKGLFSKAVQDAEEIIRIAPTQTIGYLRLGRLFSMQGKQHAAIQIYEEALTNVEKQDNDDSAYTELVQGKMRAVEKNEQRLDFISILPLEIVEIIFEDFSEPTLFRCMAVSTRWREILLNCPKIWEDADHEFIGCIIDRTAATLRVLPHIAKHIKNMKADFCTFEIGQAYLENFENGAFQKIRTLELTAASINILTSINMMLSFTNALWQVRNTLTKLDIRIIFPEGFNTSIADILFYSPHLKTLKIDMYEHSFAKHIGNMEYLGRSHIALEDVQITARSISGPILKPLLQYCPGIRRLDLKQCQPDVIDVVNEICNENLQIFAYNRYHYQVPALEELDQEYYDGPPGLRYIYTPSMFQDFNRTLTHSFVRLLHKNQKSLQTVFANLYWKYDPQPEPLTNRSHPTYEQWYFERIRNLTYRPDKYKVTEPMFLESISRCKTTSLMSFSAFETPNIPMMVDTLIHLPPVEKLKVSGIIYNDSDNKHRSAALVHLFQDYASRPPKDQKLHDVGFENCNIITDQVMMALARLESLKTIRFLGVYTIQSAKVLKEFLGKARVVSINFSRIPEVVDDDILDQLAHMEHLEELSLEEIHEITEEGVINLVDHSKTLHTLEITDCRYIYDDTEASSYIISKIKNAVICWDRNGVSDI